MSVTELRANQGSCSSVCAQTSRDSNVSSITLGTAAWRIDKIDWSCLLAFYHQWYCISSVLAWLIIRAAGPLADQTLLTKSLNTTSSFHMVHQVGCCVLIDWSDCANYILELGRLLLPNPRISETFDLTLQAIAHPITATKGAQRNYQRAWKPVAVPWPHTLLNL